MQHWSLGVGITVAILLAGGSEQTGTVYRFRSANGNGTVWVAGDDARLEPDPAEGAAGVSIWKAGGRHLFKLNATEHTYFDQVAYLSSRGGAHASPGTLTVRDPFIVAEVDNVRVDLLPSPQQQPSASEGATDCRVVSLKFSYDLKLRLKMADDGLIPGRVEGSAEYCLADSLPISRLPFGHGLEIVSGIAKVDVVLAQRLASLEGVPIRRTLTAKRQIEGGEQVSETSTLALSEFRATRIPAGRFDVPPDYRYQDPVIIGPTRQDR